MFFNKVGCQAANLPSEGQLVCTQNNQPGQPPIEQRKVKVRQKLTYLEFFFFIVVYGLLLLPGISTSQRKLVLTVLFLLSLMFTLALGYVVTAIDPTDSYVHYANNFTPATNFKCLVCKCNVKSRSRHCFQCNTCIEKYDHHCYWLNNCIGRKNYRYFLNLVSFATAMTLLFVTEAAFVLGQFRTTKRLVLHWQSKDCLPELVVLGVALGLACLTGGYLLFLLLFHIMIQCKGQTTYQFFQSRSGGQDASANRLISLQSRTQTK